MTGATLGEELVDDERGLRVEAGVGLVAEEILRIHDDGAGDGDTLLHTSRNLAWKLASRPVEVDAVETDTLHIFIHAVTDLDISE